MLSEVTDCAMTVNNEVTILWIWNIINILQRGLLYLMMAIIFFFYLEVNRSIIINFNDFFDLFSREADENDVSC